MRVCAVVEFDPVSGANARRDGICEAVPSSNRFMLIRDREIASEVLHANWLVSTVSRGRILERTPENRRLSYRRGRRLERCAPDPL